MGRIGYPTFTATYTIVSTTKTRPANTTAYTVNDVISQAVSPSGTAWTFTNMARINGGSGYIIKSRIVTDEVTGQTQRLRLYLFNATPTGELDDNDPNTEPLYADISSYLGTIDFDALDNSMSGADSSESQLIGSPMSFTCAAASRDLLGILVTLDAFTPVSGQIFTIIFEVEQTN